MLTLVSIVGLALAVIVFLNMLSPPQTGQKKKETHNGHDPENPPRLDNRKVLRTEPNVPRPRICPVCGTVLGQEDYLFAALEPEPSTQRKRQAHIYGCRFCVATDGVNLSREKISQIEP